MDYLKIYNQLMFCGKARNIHGYTEKHHIIPRCIGGNNDITNSVELTAREHFIAHLLLVKIYPNNKRILFALNAMCNLQSSTHRGQRINNRLFGKLRETSKKLHTGLKRYDETKIKMSIAQSGKIVTKETKEKMSKSHKGRVPWHKSKSLSDAHKKNISSSLTGRKLPNEVCEKMSKSRKGHPVTGETREKISKSNKGRSGYMTGRVHSDDSKKRIAESNKLSHTGKKRCYRSDGTWFSVFPEKP